MRELSEHNMSLLLAGATRRFVHAGRVHDLEHGCEVGCAGAQNQDSDVLQSTAPFIQKAFSCGLRAALFVSRSPDRCASPMTARSRVDGDHPTGGDRCQFEPIA